MYQIKESQHTIHTFGFLYAELAFTLMSISIAFIALAGCLLQCHYCRHTTTSMLDATQNFSLLCYEIRTQGQTSSLASIKKKKISSIMQNAELPVQKNLNTNKPFHLTYLS